MYSMFRDSTIVINRTICQYLSSQVDVINAPDYTYDIFTSALHFQKLMNL